MAAVMICQYIAYLRMLTITKTQKPYPFDGSFHQKPFTLRKEYKRLFAPGVLTELVNRGRVQSVPEYMCSPEEDLQGLPGVFVGYKYILHSHFLSTEKTLL